MIDALTATGPHREYADELTLFGQLVGSWDIADTHFNADGTPRKVQPGEWHFDWVLEGRAVQDVIVSPPLQERRQTGAPANEYGTTLRFYDPKIGAWRVSFVAPVIGAIVNLIARRSRDDIVLEGRGPDGVLYRWMFSDITEETFRWRGYESSDEGRTRVMDEEMTATRRILSGS